MPQRNEKVLSTSARSPASECVAHRSADAFLGGLAHKFLCGRGADSLGPGTCLNQIGSRGRRILAPLIFVISLVCILIIMLT